uniref:dTDP-glucose 4,6-dehydratase n=1 Tax=Erysipelothrix tonsillarum TaxID=38402 RepID=A0A6S6I3M9_9FIRM|nr:dTDP-glucose 4,6-dehydratase [Erysipelothrix tonsillarum]
MKYLITGGAGFIGSNFVRYMCSEYVDVELVVVDSLTYAGNLCTIDDLIRSKKITFYEADIADRERMNDIFEYESFDVVVNFAAESHVDRSIENPELFLRTNIIGTEVLLSHSLKYGVERYHQVSTDEVYGDLPLDRPDLLFTEDTPIKTSSPYSSSKAAADLLVQAYYKTYGLPISISRCSNNYGPYHHPEKLIPLTITKALNNEKIPVYGTGENIRDWLYVEDHCVAIQRIIENGNVGEVYNVGGHNEITNLDVVKNILLQLDKSTGLIEFVGDRKGHDLRYAIDPSKMNKDLGWEPSTTFDIGIKKTVEWYQKNREWTSEVLERNI